jgi:L-amino acid N-acyltransferase YncA
MKKLFSGQIRNIREADLDSVRSILEEWQVDHHTGKVATPFINATLREIEKSIDGKNHRTYLVAETAGNHILGLMGINDQDINPSLTAEADKPVEIVSAYITHAARNQGVGSALLDHLERLARDRGFTDIVVVSGSRTRSGYPFWTKHYGQPTMQDPDHYGPGEEQVVWSKHLPPALS